MGRSVLKNVLQTESCLVTVNSQKNRIYGTIKGSFEDTFEPSEYMEELHDIRQYVSRGFTVLFDASQLTGQVQEASTFVRYFQELVVEGGVSNIAEILPESSTAIGRYGRISGLTGVYSKRCVFTNREDAEAWLESRFSHNMAGLKDEER